MGRLAEKFAQRFAEARARTPRSRRLRRDPELDLASVPSVPEFVARGHSQLHAHYLAAQHVASTFSEYASQFPILASFREAVMDAEEEYMPGGPPMSPLTTSYFTSWAFFDLRFGPDQETLGDCLLRVVDTFDLDPQVARALRHLAASRMGVYAHEGGRRDSALVLLRELVTGDAALCEVPAGRRGVRGELWYARVCPPLLGVASNHLVFTTPYVLVQTSPADWTAYLRRSLPAAGAGDDRAGLHELMKFGPTPHAWHEFVLLGYHDSAKDAVFLAGLPDVPGSLPHA